MKKTTKSLRTLVEQAELQPIATSQLPALKGGKRKGIVDDDIDGI